MVSVPAFKDLMHFGSVITLAVGALFPIVDPLGGAPIYLAMTSGHGRGARPDGAAVAINSFLLLLASALVGAYVLDFFGLSIPAVQVAGGIVVCHDRVVPAEQPLCADAAGAQCRWNDDARGSGTTRVLSHDHAPHGRSRIDLRGVDSRRQSSAGLRPLLLTTLAHALGILIVAASVLLCYRYADRIVSRLGATGTSVVVRLSAFILLCIGVQICWNGIHSLLAGEVPHSTVGRVRPNMAHSFKSRAGEIDNLPSGV